jgi:hypothetical protein
MFAAGEASVKRLSPSFAERLRIFAGWALPTAVHSMLVGCAPPYILGSRPTSHVYKRIHEPARIHTGPIRANTPALGGVLKRNFTPYKSKAPPIALFFHMLAFHGSRRSPF